MKAAITRDGLNDNAVRRVGCPRPARHSPITSCISRWAAEAARIAGHTWTTARGRSFRGPVPSGANLATESWAARGVKITRGFLHAALHEPGRAPPAVAADAPEVVHPRALRAVRRVRRGGAGRAFKRDGPVQGAALLRAVSELGQQPAHAPRCQGHDHRRG